MLARVEGTKAIVELYGIPDDRTVTMNGPYFSNNAPDDIRFHGQPLTTNQIAWTRDITNADGSQNHDVFISTYKGFPRSLWKKYTNATANILMAMQ
jgi:hypothetical protein